MAQSAAAKANGPLNVGRLHSASMIEIGAIRLFTHADCDAVNLKQQLRSADVSGDIDAICHESALLANELVH